jgi:predicted TPR repeat methyltransferase
MGNIFRMTGQLDQALEAYQRSKEMGSTHPATYRAIAELSGEQIPEDPDLVRTLFNQYAKDFDRDLQERLEYSTPQLAHQILLEHLPDFKIGCLLDLGCGTGLSIIPFHTSELRATGVDISEQMLSKAKEKNLYSTVHCQEILSFLRSESKSYDLVLCLDTMVYIQDLLPLLQEVKSCLSPSGYFLCSTEVGQGKKPRLQPSGRYAHPEKYFRRIAEESGLSILAQQHARLRKDGEQWINGIIWLMEPVAPPSLA